MLRMILAENLCRKYGDRVAVEELSFHVRKGEVMGLLGPNGAGKSTTMKMLTCFLPPSSGDASIGGIQLGADDVAIRRKVGYLPESAPSYQELDVRTHLSFIGCMHAIPEATLKDRIAEIAGFCGLGNVLNRRIDELSKGYRQRVGLAASMLHEPECLILDEPTTGLDPNQVVEIRHLIRDLAKEKTVLLSSHVLPEVEAVCDRMMIIDAGRLQALGSPAELAELAQGGSVVHLKLKGEAAPFVEKLFSRLSDVTCDTGADGSMTLHHADPKAELAEHLFFAAVESGNVILEMRQEKTTLEDVFRKLTGGGA